MLLDACNPILSGRFTSSGLSRDLENAEYYQPIDGGGALPLRWCSPEVLANQKFGEASDVWAYGVTLIEVFYRARQPYYGWTNVYVCERVRDGFKLPRPASCPPAVYATVILPCFELNPAHRPSFRELHEALINPVQHPGSQASAACGDVQDRSPTIDCGTTLRTCIVDVNARCTELEVQMLQQLDDDTRRVFLHMAEVRDGMVDVMAGDRGGMDDVCGNQPALPVGTDDMTTFAGVLMTTMEAKMLWELPTHQHAALLQDARVRAPPGQGWDDPNWVVSAGARGSDPQTTPSVDTAFGTDSSTNERVYVEGLLNGMSLMSPAVTPSAQRGTHGEVPSTGPAPAISLLQRQIERQMDPIVEGSQACPRGSNHASGGSGDGHSRHSGHGGCSHTSRASARPKPPQRPTRTYLPIAAAPGTAHGSRTPSLYAVTHPVDAETVTVRLQPISDSLRRHGAAAPRSTARLEQDGVYDDDAEDVAAALGNQGFAAGGTIRNTVFDLSAFEH